MIYVTDKNHKTKNRNIRHLAFAFYFQTMDIPENPILEMSELSLLVCFLLDSRASGVQVHRMFSQFSQFPCLPASLCSGERRLQESNWYLVYKYISQGNCMRENQYDRVVNFRDLAKSSENKREENLTRAIVFVSVLLEVALFLLCDDYMYLPVFYPAKPYIKTYSVHHNLEKRYK